MPLSTQAPAAKMSLIYITSGAVIIVWTVVWLFYLIANPPSSSSPYYFVFGFMATGGVMLAIGLRLGSIGRAARQAETPAQTVVTPAPPVVEQAPAQVISNSPPSDALVNNSGPAMAASGPVQRLP